MAQLAKDIRINELLDANSQLNTTVKHLVDALTQKDRAVYSTYFILKWKN